MAHKKKKREPFFQRLKNFRNGPLRTITENHLNRDMMRYFDWWLFACVIAISLFGVVTIFSATSSEVVDKPATIIEMLRTQSTRYPTLQLMWIGAGIVAMFVLMFFDYKVYGKYSQWLYAANIIILLLVLGVERGRGGMTAFFTWGSSSDRGFQPSEFGKVIIIIALAARFAERKHVIMKFDMDLIKLVLYMAVPMVLVVAQPDVGTALVYIVIFCVLILVSGTNWKLIVGVIAAFVLLLIPVWYFMNNMGSDNFRLTRILIWLDPDSYPDEARQVINGQIALGSGGLTGKGIVSPGSFASLGYISDDHTDFIFSIVCESFGLVGAIVLIVLYMLMFARLIYHAWRVTDPFGAFILVGVIGMFLFHVVENLCMVTGLLPVTGIPLPFVSYGGSNMLTNMMAIGLAENVIIRYDKSESNRRSYNTNMKRHST